MSQTLYRKYRPKNFSEVIGQNHIVRTLSNALIHNRVGQAYLFTGPRGTGKTSIARILAKTVNCLELKKAISCEKCANCNLVNEGKTLDIIEIDAASNTGVDNIRELRETIALPPTVLQYKVYIIDEIHMLSTGAFNALLKTLEEPPAHVIFILATTEIHKVPETIISRCQRFDFSRLPIQNIIEKLSIIAKKEKITIEESALEMIAISAEGGMRDAESLFSQIIALEDKNITVAEVKEILGSTDREVDYEIAKMIINQETSSAINRLNSLLNDGFDLEIFAKSLINYFRQLMLLKINPELKNCFSYETTREELNKMSELANQANLADLIKTLNLLLEAKEKISSFILPQLPLEIAIIKATQMLPTLSDKQQSRSDELKQEERSKKKEVSDGNVGLSPKLDSFKEMEESADSSNKQELTTKNTPSNNIEPVEQLGEGKIDIDTVRANWNRLLQDVQPHNHSLRALLCSCQIQSVNGNEITLATPYDFYQDKLNDHTNRLTIEEVFGKILELKVKLKAVVDKSLARKEISDCPKEESKHEQDSLLSSALEIMGGKIVE